MEGKFPVSVNMPLTRTICLSYDVIMGTNKYIDLV